VRDRYIDIKRLGKERDRDERKIESMVTKEEVRDIQARAGSIHIFYKR
jgi:hypothetical protein